MGERETWTEIVRETKRQTVRDVGTGGIGGGGDRDSERDREAEPGNVDLAPTGQVSLKIEIFWHRRESDTGTLGEHTHVCHTHKCVKGSCQSQ